MSARGREADRLTQPATACLMVAVVVVACSCAQAATLLTPHQIQDMVLLGQGGESQSLHSRAVTLAGDHLYVSGQPGLQTVRVTDPTDLAFVDDYPDTSAQPNGSAVRDGFLYLANWSPNIGLVVFDLYRPYKPTAVRTLVTSRHAWEVEFHDNLMYVTIGDETNAGFHTYDISTPGDPVLLGTFLIGDRLFSNVARTGNYLYFTHKSQLYVYNGADPASPQHVRTMSFNALLGNVRIRHGYLYVLGRTISPGEQGGIRVFSLTDPTNPQPVEFWEQSEPRDMHFQGDYCIVPCSGSGIYTLDVSDPHDITVAWHWYVSWPGAGSHGGYPINADGAGRFVYIGTTHGNNPECEDPSCPYYGGRVYSVQVFREPPMLAPVAPDPDVAAAGSPYVRQLTLLEGGEPITWSVVQGPIGTQVSDAGLVTSWTPGLGEIGQVRAFEVQATNSDGTASESWSVHVQLIGHCDFDGDEDVDQADFGHLQKCLTGPEKPVMDPDCLDARQDSPDADVDQDDLAIFLACHQLSGADVPAPESCRR